MIDKTNATIEQRARYIALAKEYKFTVIGYYFASDLAAAMERNNRRTGKAKIPEKGIHAAYSRLQIPELSEGFDELFYVKIGEENNFIVEKLQNEI